MVFRAEKGAWMRDLKLEGLIGSRVSDLWVMWPGCKVWRMSLVFGLRWLGLAFRVKGGSWELGALRFRGSETGDFPCHVEAGVERFRVQCLGRLHVPATLGSWILVGSEPQEHKSSNRKV